MRIRDLAEPDLAPVVRLHRTVMASEFLASCGPGFLLAYYRAWMRSPAGIALVVEDGPDKAIIAVLLGSIDPAQHYRWIVRHGWMGFSIRLALRGLSRPGWAAAFLRSRSRRYARGLMRMMPRVPRLGVSSAAAEAVVAAPVDEPRVAEITHLMVTETARGRGVGRGLVEEACVRARRAHAQLAVVVTPPGWSAESFYARLGWRRIGEITSASDEPFVRYELSLDTAARVSGRAPAIAGRGGEARHDPGVTGHGSQGWGSA